MAKLTKELFNKYKTININGFKVDLQKLMYQFAHGDEYAQMRQTVLDTESEQIILTISFFKFYKGTAEYTIKAEQYKKSEGSKFMMGGHGCFSKTYYKEELEKARFNFKHIQELAEKFDITELKAEVMKDYEEYQNKKNNIDYQVAI